VTIRQVLTKVTAITNYSGLAALIPRVKRGKEKVNPDTFTGWQSDLETCELTYLNLTVGSLAVLNTVATVTDANLETEANDNADTQTWKIRQRIFTKNEDNTGTFICTFLESNSIAFDAANFKKTGVTDPDGFISTGRWKLFDRSIIKISIHLLRKCDRFRTTLCERGTQFCNCCCGLLEWLRNKGSGVCS
jgi:hypothetical protein